MIENALWLDIEASGLANDSYPIEVGWCDFSGKTGHVLIAPCPDWTHWDDNAEHLHGISRSTLNTEGHSVTEAAQIVALAVADKVVFSDSPLFDARWLYKLFFAAGWSDVPCHLEDADDLLLNIVKNGRLGMIDKIEIEITAQKIAPITHRAADDAMFWATLTRLALERQRV